MNPETLSNAQSLRVIGQHLNSLGVATFKLERHGEHYVVVTNNRESTASLDFTGADICSADLQARLRRSKPGGVVWAHNLSSRMRVLGNYFDRKGVKEFALSWFPDFVEFQSNYEKQRFSVHQNLYDLGVGMFMNRSAPIPAASSVQTATPRPASSRAVAQLRLLPL